MAVHHALAADLLLINGRVLTMDVHNSVAQAVAVRDGKIVAVGTNAEVEPLAGASTQVIDLDGRTAMPGLTDCHVHLASDSSRSVESVECRDLYDPSIDSVEALVTRMGQWAASTPPGQWIVARGSPLADFRLHERRLPTQAELDGALLRNPAYVSFGAHVVIANTLALRERGVTRDTPSPQGGTVVKDPVTGEPGALAPSMVSWHADAAALLTPQAPGRRRGGEKGLWNSYPPSNSRRILSISRST
jgi:predicted amidohydrolase YtcJ